MAEADALAASKAAFRARVGKWASTLGVTVRGVYVREMRTKWASCSTNGILTFNRELLALDEQLWDYVIVHELLHFDVPNHGKLWKSLMRAHVGDWEACEERLRAYASGGDAPVNAAHSRNWKKDSGDNSA